jgi:hypothetical protein
LGGIVKILIVLCVALLPLAAHGQLLKCIGKDGRIEYASQCPPGSRQESTGIRSSPAAPGGEAAQKSLAEREAEFQKRRAERQEAEALAAKKAAEAEQRKRACDDARGYLKNLQARNRIVKTNPDTGERTFLDEAGYASEMAIAQKSIDANCN